jgi:glycerol kinase
MAGDGRLYVAIDAGGHAVRALVFDAAGGERARAGRPVATYRDGVRVEQDADAMAAAARAALDEVCTRLGTAARRIAAAGLATQRASVVCADRDTGRPLTPVLSWQDRRAAAWLAAQPLDAEAVRSETGLLSSPHYGASKLRWCLDHVPAVRDARAVGRLAMGPLSAFLTSQLARERPWLVDPCNASRTLLWSLRGHDWSAALLAKFGIPREALPRCVGNRHRFGHVTAGARALPLTVVTGDQSAVPYAGGAPDRDTLYVNLGTGAFLQRLCDGETPPPARLLRSVVWLADGAARYCDEATINGAGAALEALAAESGLPVGELFAHLDRWLDDTASPPLFLNGVSGLGSPWWVADFPSRFDGEGGVPAQAVAVVESIAFLIRRNLDEWAAAGFVPRRLVLTGGLARLDGLCRRIASLAACRCERPAKTEATARGLAFLVADNPGEWAPPSVRYFEPRQDAALRARCDRWQALMAVEAARHTLR